MQRLGPGLGILGAPLLSDGSTALRVGALTAQIDAGIARSERSQKLPRLLGLGSRDKRDICLDDDSIFTCTNLGVTAARARLPGQADRQEHEHRVGRMRRESDDEGTSRCAPPDHDCIKCGVWWLV